MLKLYRFLILALFLASFASCKKDSLGAFEVDPVFMSNEEAISHFKKNFIDGQSAWKAILSTKNTGKAYGLYITLSEKGEVNMLSDLYPDAGTQYTTTSYKLRAQAGNAVLSFANGSYLDDIFLESGRYKISADTSYTFRYALQDTLVLLGNEHGDELKLVKTTVEERNAYNASAFYFSLWNTYNYFAKNRFHSFIYGGGKAVQIMIDQNERSAIAYYVEDGKLVTTTSYVSYGINEVNFKTPLRINGKEVKQLFIDPDKITLYTKEGGQRTDLIGSRVPIIPLHLFLGHGVPNIISAPNPFTYYAFDGWSDDAYLIWYNTTLELYNSPYQAEFILGDFEFIEKTKQMNIAVHFRMDNRNYKGIFPFRYSRTATGVYKFVALPFQMEDPLQANASLIQPYIMDFIGMVQQNSFKLDYFDMEKYLLGQFKGVENPEIYFTGYFGSLAE